MPFKEKYINPFTDFGFKRLFGQENHKEFLIDFLNQLLPEKHQVKNLTYLHSEQNSDTTEDRRAIFDLYCTAENGDRFIVEMQVAHQTFFKERMIYYSTFPIRDQAKKGKWKFELKSVYTVAILDFTLSKKIRPGEVFHLAQLKDQNGDVFYDKLTFIYLEMPNFVKKETELTSNFDKWMFVLKNLTKMRNKPEVLKEIVFGRFLDAAELARFSPEEVWKYEQSLKHYRDMHNVVETAYDDGKAEGIEVGKAVGIKEGIEVGKAVGIKEGIELGKAEGKIENTLQIAAVMKAGGLSVEIIMKVTGLSSEAIEGL